MTDLSDMDLARKYATGNSEPAFAELVRRHLNLVYSVALRFADNPQDAQDITQAVFIILAQKAVGLRQRTVLTGWLYETTRFTALRFLRTKNRRQFREQEAYMQSTLDESNPDGVWLRLAPLLEDGMARLNEKERALLALRFYENRTGAEAAAQLGIEEWAARKRMERALEKLRKFFSQRGAVFSATAIAGAISANSVHAAPLGLAKTVSALALTKGATAGGSTLTLAKGALKLMAWSKTQTAIVAGVVVLFAAGTTTVTVKEIHEHQNDEWQLGEISENLLLKPPFRTVILPTKIADKRRQNRTPGTISMADGRAVGINASLENILRWAYSPAHGEEGGEYDELSPARIVLDTTLATNRYDYFSNQPKGSRNALQHEIKREFGLVARFETIETNVLILKFKPENYGKLKLSSGKLPSRTEISNGAVSAGGQTAEDFTRTLETSYFFFPVINQTGLTNKYDFEASWDSTDPVHSRSNLEQALTDQIGLELVPTNLPVEMLIVEKVDN